MSARARRGMTLMELVIALAITGIMAAAGAGTFASIIDHRRTIQHASLSIERAAALREMIHSWLITGSVQIQRGGGPRGVSRGVAAARPATQAGNNIASVSAAQASGDELNFTTTALNPSLLANVRMRLYIDGDNNTPEKGLTIEYQPSARMPLVRRMLDSTIDTLRVEFLDGRTHRWLRASEAATLTPHAFRVTLLHGEHGPLPAILELPMVFLISDFSMQVRR